jgi:hypothetical protein
LTCVTVAKRLLGIRAPYVLTPWQLYQQLETDGFLRFEVQGSATQPLPIAEARALWALDSFL